ncbi:MAG: phage portal protein [Bacilli bacterium]|nr:phage portal protein [Bacilli bacterium]
MENLLGIEYLRNKLECKKLRVKTRYDFYEMKNRSINHSIVIPPELSYMFNSTLGWCAKAVDQLADRMIFKGFKDDPAQFNYIYQMNNADTLYDSAILGALIASCSFIYISVDKDGFPRMQVIDAKDATGVIDPITGLMTEGYAILERDKEGNPKTEAYFKAYETEYIYAGVKEHDVYTHEAPYALLVPIIFKPDSVRPFGHSRITRDCMNIQVKACNCITRADISAEFYSFPQRYVLGTSQESDPIDAWKASIAAMLEITKDENGDRPTIGQFQQQSMAPHLDQVKMYASLFAGATGITLDDLGYPSANPSSVDAIKAAHESLRSTGRKAQRTIGTGFLNAAYLSQCLMDRFTYQRSEFYRAVPKWMPLFELDPSSISAIGDAIIKINQSNPGYLTNDVLEELLGF